MKKIVSAVAVAAAMVGFGMPVAYAGPADVVKAQGCIGFDANGSPWADPTAELQFVFTNNANGVANVRCKGQLPAAAVLPKKALHFDNANTGFICLGGDETWKMTVTPNGSFTFTCHIN